MNAKQLREDQTPGLVFLSPEITTSHNAVLTQRPKRMLLCLKLSAPTGYSLGQPFRSYASPVRKNAKSVHYRLHLENGGAKLFRKKPVTNNKEHVMNLLCEYRDSYDYQTAVSSETNDSGFNSKQKSGKRVFLKILFRSYLKDLDTCLEKVILPGDQLYISGSRTEIQHFIRSSEQAGKITGVVIHQAETDI